MDKVYKEWRAGLFICRDDYTGWAIDEGHLFIVRFGDIIKVIVGKNGYESLKKAIFSKDEKPNLLYDGYSAKPYEAKKKLNILLKNYKTSPHNNYEYKISDIELIDILSLNKDIIPYPFDGDLKEQIAKIKNSNRAKI